MRLSRCPVSGFRERAHNPQPVKALESAVWLWLPSTHLPRYHQMRLPRDGPANLQPVKSVKMLAALQSWHGALILIKVSDALRHRAVDATISGWKC